MTDLRTELEALADLAAETVALEVLIDWESGWRQAHRRFERDIRAPLAKHPAPTSPKPDEPTGLGAVVEDADGHLWTSVTNMGADDRWQPNHLRDSCYRRHWANVAAVRVLSEGVNP